METQAYTPKLISDVTESVPIKVLSITPGETVATLKEIEPEILDFIR